jgi:glutamine amidotransferase-like uncharacterized protein
MNNKVFLFFSAITLFAPSISAWAGADVAIYNGKGTWADGRLAFEKFLDSQGITWKEVSAADINGDDFKSSYNTLFMPGGYASDYWWPPDSAGTINSAGNQHIRDLVSSGGSYIGICAGAFYAADKIIWQGVEYDYPLNLFNGIAVGEITEIIPWAGYKMTGININKANPINVVQPSSYTMVYYGGPYLLPDGSQQIETLATYQVNNQKAAINFKYGNGRVLLMGPHPEIEENSNRDGSTWGSELDDVESDWPFLQATVMWAVIRGAAAVTTKPNPYSLSSGRPLKFFGAGVIPYDTKINIYTLSGDMVTGFEEKSGQAEIPWDGRNSAGNKIVPGIYLFTSYGPKGKTRGQFTVVK